MSQSGKRIPNKSSLLSFPLKKQPAEVRSWQQAQLHLEEKIRPLNKELEIEPDPDAQKAIRAHLWTLVTTGKTE